MIQNAQSEAIGTPEPLSVSDLVEPLAESMPPVTSPGEPGGMEPPVTGKPPEQTAPEAKPVEPPSPSAQAMGKDSLGRAFDPAKFRPEKDILGRWKNLKGGKPKSGTATAKPPRKPQTAPEAKPVSETALPEMGESVIPPDMPEEPAAQPGADAGPDRFALAAEAYLFAGYSLLDGAMAGKGEWMPDNQAEHDALKGALTAWLRSRDSEDLPPGAAFALAAVGYGAKRFQRPNTQTRWRIYWLYIRAWWGNRAARAKLDAIGGAS